MFGQSLPLKIACIVPTDTAYFSDSDRLASPEDSLKRIDLTSSSDSLMTALDAVPLSFGISPEGQFQSRPVRMPDTYPTGTPHKRPISVQVLPPATNRLTTISTVSLGYFPALVGLVSRWNLPRFLEWFEFSDGEQYSRFSDRLLFLTQSKWFTCVLPSGGAPINAAATSLWTFANFFGPFPLKGTTEYPPASDWPFIKAPLRWAGPQGPAMTLSSDLTRPKSLTSYKPSYPTTALQFSISIFTSFRGFAPSSRLLIHRLTSVLQGTARLPSVSALLELRRVGRPMFGAFPTLGLGCRS